MIDEVNTERELNQHEDYWIAYYESYNPIKGYNIRTSNGFYYNKPIISEQLKKQRSDRMRGERNPQYGKKEHCYGLIRYHNERKGKPIEDIMGIEKATKFRENCSKRCSGQNNPMYNKNVYEIWVKKDGIEIANQKYNEMLNKKSNAMKGLLMGERNPCYKHIDENIKKQIFKLYNEGKTIYYIFKELNMTHYKVKQILGGK